MGRKFQKIRKQIKRRDFYTCVACGREPAHGGVRLEVHHIVPKEFGGSDQAVNLITLCEVCHKEVHDLIKYMIELHTAKEGEPNVLVKREYAQMALSRIIAKHTYKDPLVEDIIKPR